MISSFFALSGYWVKENYRVTMQLLKGFHFQRILQYIGRPFCDDTGCKAVSEVSEQNGTVIGDV